MQQFIHLILQRIFIRLIAIAQRTYGDSGCEIQIRFFVCIVKIYTLTMIKYKSKTIVGMQQFLLRGINIFLFVHCLSTPLISYSL